MSRFRLVLLSLFAAFVLSSAGSGSASASCGGGTGWVYCNSVGKEIGSPPAEILGKSGIGVLEAKIGGAAVRAECKHGILKGQLELLGKRKGFGLGFECKVVEPAGCLMNETLEGNAEGQLIGPMGTPREEFTGSGAEERFATVTIAACAIAGTYSVTGKQICELPKAEESLVEHEIVCKKSGSKLKVGLEPVTMSSTAKATLTSGEAWLVMLGS